MAYIEFFYFTLETPSFASVLLQEIREGTTSSQHLMTLEHEQATSLNNGNIAGYIFASSRQDMRQIIILSQLYIYFL